MAIENSQGNSRHMAGNGNGLSPTRLGKGLAALLGETGSDASTLERARRFRRVPIEFLAPNPLNPRKAFSDTDIAELTNSVREKGILQAIVVRELPDTEDRFEIVAGERRWRAAKAADLSEVPISICDANDREALEIAIVENVQRENLNAIEEAQGYKRLAQSFSYTQADIATATGKSRSHIANTIRLLNLPSDVISLLAKGSLSAGHARALLAHPDPSALAAEIVKQGLSVREVEDSIRSTNAKPEKRKPTLSRKFRMANRQIAKSLSRSWNTSVRIRGKTNDSGTIVLDFSSRDELLRLTKALGYQHEAIAEGPANERVA